MGIASEDYENDKVKDIDILNKGVVIYDDFDKQVIEKLYQLQGIPVKEVSIGKDLPLNQYFVLRNGNQSVLSFNDPVSGLIRRRNNFV